MNSNLQRERFCNVLRHILSTFIIFIKYKKVKREDVTPLHSIQIYCMLPTRSTDEHSNFLSQQH